MPRCRAMSRPAADALLAITTAISASSLPRAMLFAMASKFEPRPEIRIPRRTSAVLHFAFTALLFDDLADNPWLLAGFPPSPFRRAQLRRGNGEDHSHAQIERPSPVVFGHVADLPQHFKERWRLPGRSI